MTMTFTRALCLNWFVAGLNKKQISPVATTSHTKGKRRWRLPVALKIAFATAGATGGVPGSP